MCLSPLIHPFVPNFFLNSLDEWVTTKTSQVMQLKSSVYKSTYSANNLEPDGELEAELVNLGFSHKKRDYKLLHLPSCESSTSRYMVNIDPRRISKLRVN